MKQGTLDALVSEAREYVTMVHTGERMAARGDELLSTMDARIVAAGFDPAEIVKLAYAAQ